MTSVVYFVQAPSGAIKIGWTGDLHRRMQNLQSATHETIEVLATLPGDAILEAHLHERFAECKLHGEWFRSSQPLLDLIGAVKAGAYRSPAGYQAQSREPRCTTLGTKRADAQEEAQHLIGIIAGPRALGDRIKTSLARVAEATGLGERRVRAMWHREARSILAEEMGRLREIAAKRLSQSDAWPNDPALGLRSRTEDRALDQGR